MAEIPLIEIFLVAAAKDIDWQYLVRICSALDDVKRAEDARKKGSQTSATPPGGA